MLWRREEGFWVQEETAAGRERVQSWVCTDAFTHAQYVAQVFVSSWTPEGNKSNAHVLISVFGKKKKQCLPQKPCVYQVTVGMLILVFMKLHSSSLRICEHMCMWDGCPLQGHLHAFFKAVTRYAPHNQARKHLHSPLDYTRVRPGGFVQLIRYKTKEDIMMVDLTTIITLAACLRYTGRGGAMEQWTEEHRRRARLLCLLPPPHSTLH